MNQFYVKRYDEQGVLLNPILKSFINNFPNRAKRRQKDVRFQTNHKGVQLTTHGQFAFHRIAQVEWDKNGNEKYILHYVPKRR